MKISPCPKCAQQVGVPPEATPFTSVRCPLCQAEFSLDEVWPTEPPMLEMLGVSSTETEGEPVSQSSLNTEQQSTIMDESIDQGENLLDPSEEPKAEEEFRLADPVEIVPVNPFDFNLSEGDSSRAEFPSSVSLRSSTRPQKNMVFEMFKMGAAGVVGLAIGIVILWWGAGSDPFSLVEKLPENLSFLAPQSLQYDASELGAETNWPEDQDGTNDFNSTEPGLGLLASQEDPSQGFSSLLGKANENSFLRSTESSLPLETPVAITPPVLGVVGAPKYHLDELDTALLSARQSLALLEQVLDTSEPMAKKVRQQLALEFYAAQCRLSNIITFLDTSSQGIPARLQKITEIAQQISNDPAKLSLLGTLAARHLHLAERDGPGILLIGVVKSVTAHGENLYETRLELFGKNKQVVPILSWHDPSTTYSAGSQVVLLGSIVTTPSANLPGYQGADPQVVFGGFPVVVTKN